MVDELKSRMTWRKDSATYDIAVHQLCATISVRGYKEDSKRKTLRTNHLLQPEFGENEGVVGRFHNFQAERDVEGVGLA